MKFLTPTAPSKAKGGAVALLALALLLAGCSTTGGTNGNPSSSAASSCASTGTPFSTDDAPDGVNYSDLASKLGDVPKPKSGAKIGSIMKFLGNQYWQALSDGQTKRAKTYGIDVDVQAASSESDQIGQLNSAETMVTNGYTAMLVSPQTDTNLCPAVEKAEAASIPVLDVNDAVLPGAQHWVGPNQIQNGISAAKFVIKNVPAGSKVAIIQGQAGVYAAKQRTAGFTDTAKQGGLNVVASVPGDWDVTKAHDAAATILQQYPDLQAFYANNDTNAIRSGDLAATVDSYPVLTGEVSVDVALRIVGGQVVPRAVYTPQALITKDNVDDPAPTL